MATRKNEKIEESTVYGDKLKRNSNQLFLTSCRRRLLRITNTKWLCVSKVIV
uniref:Uncharacterized protein n=1 Tax=Arion vulgaris TaxID=1028688 RepID=A0A0B6Z893_9EUPU